MRSTEASRKIYLRNAANIETKGKHMKIPTLISFVRLVLDVKKFEIGKDTPFKSFLQDCTNDDHHYAILKWHNGFKAVFTQETQWIQKVTFVFPNGKSITLIREFISHRISFEVDPEITREDMKQFPKEINDDFKIVIVEAN